VLRNIRGDAAVQAAIAVGAHRATAVQRHCTAHNAAANAAQM
jgi:hypothetical protein